MVEQTQLEAKLLAELRQSMSSQANAQRYVVAVSGGLDSMVLLHLAARLIRPVVLHVNHQLSPNANEWQQHVLLAAQSLGAEFFACPVTVVNAGKGLEQAAREARYQAFAEFLQPGDCLLLAHHQNDQAETFLLRLLRGAGLTGLGAMAQGRELGQANLLRPLLNIPRCELLRYAELNSITWVEDESNSSERFDRNFIRHQIMPNLTERWPAAVRQISQTTNLLRADAELLKDYLATDLAALHSQQERWGFSLAIGELLNKTLHRRQCLLRLWLANLGFAIPAQSHLHQIENLLIAREDAEGCVTFGNCEIRRYRQRLFAMLPLPKVDPQWRAPWNNKMPAELPPGSFLPSQPENLNLPMGHYELRFRQGGERCHPRGHAHSQTLKKLLQEYGVEPWLRDRVPLVYCEEKMVAVGDLWVNENVSK